MHVVVDGSMDYDYVVYRVIQHLLGADGHHLMMMFVVVVDDDHVMCFFSYLFGNETWSHRHVVVVGADFVVVHLVVMMAVVSIAGGG